MFIEIIRHTPTWVWVLFVALLALGLSQARTQQLPVRRLVVLPLVMLALGVSTLLSGLHKMPSIALVWLLWLALAFAAAQRWLVPAAARWDATAQRVQLPGSLWPLALIMLTFVLKYAIGVFQAMQPQAASTPTFLISLAAASGLLSGLWSGRAWGLLRLARGGRTVAFGGDTMAPHGIALDR
jgi:hypothetical protein